MSTMKIMNYFWTSPSIPPCSVMGICIYIKDNKRHTVLYFSALAQWPNFQICLPLKRLCKLHQQHVTTIQVVMLFVCTLAGRTTDAAQSIDGKTFWGSFKDTESWACACSCSCLLHHNIFSYFWRYDNIWWYLDFPIQIKLWSNVFPMCLL